MSTTIVIVNWNGGRDLPDCLRSIAAQSSPPLETVLVDNSSTDGSVEVVEAEFPWVRVMRLPTNQGFGAAINIAAASIDAGFIAILNPDVVLDQTWIEVIDAAFALDPTVGIVGTKLLFPDGITIQHAGGMLRRPLMLADHRGYRQPDNPSDMAPVDVEYVTGAALVIRRECFEALRGFDDRFFLYFEETDLCARARGAGWIVRYLPQARGVHRESAVTERDSPAYFRAYHLGRVRFALKHVTPIEILSEFISAERERIGSVVSLDELTGLRHAFALHAASLATSESDGLARSDTRLRPILAMAFDDLARQSLVTIPSSFRDPPASTHLAERVEVRPEAFHSDFPVAGKAVVAVRTAWNWMSTRWYLAPILAQQNAINREIADRLEDVQSRLRQIDQRLDIQAGWLIEVDRDLRALQRRVGIMESMPDRQPRE